VADNKIYKTQKICRYCSKWRHAYKNGYKVMGICHEDLMKQNVKLPVDLEDITFFTSSMFGCVYHQFRQTNNGNSMVVCVIPHPRNE
jgi:hypothetical protein